MPIKALMVDVDGVLVDGRPEDGSHWLTSVEADLGFTSAALHERFFARHWDDIVVGRAGLLEHLQPALREVAPRVDAADFISYWFERDSRIVEPLLSTLSAVRAAGIDVFLATNQEHLRAAYLMDELGLSDHVDGIFYSARVGAKKPDREFFARVQAMTQLQGSDILLIDDSAANIDAALKAGWHALHWTKDSSPDSVRAACL